MISFYKHINIIVIDYHIKTNRKMSLYDRTMFSYWFKSIFIKQSKGLHVNYPTLDYVVFTQNGTGSQSLPFFYIFTSIVIVK